MKASPINYNHEKQILTISQGKTGVAVSVPVTETLAGWLAQTPEGDPATPFYVLWRGKPISQAGFTSRWQTLKKITGVNPNLWLHDLRRTLAVSLYEVSKDLRVVEQMLGHRSLTSTAVYLEHRDPSKLKPYLDAMFTPKGPVQ